jgi:2,4-dienoyl-CoA reductase-like NADH-dependent reductase (Old Yellow Enzyme family)
MTILKHLFSPIQIGRMTAKNRLLMSAMSINFGVDENNYVTDQLTGYLVARAKGGAGMILVGGAGVHPTGLELPGLPALWNDACIPALEKMVDAVKPFDTRFGIQLMHGGRQSYHDRKVAPSPIPAPAVVKGVPKELSIADIAELVASFGDAARRCRDAGFDFVEVHGAHGYLINQFLAPNSNHRQDRYGGSFENRIRFFLELLADIKAKAGADFPVGLRINGDDYIDGGWTLTDALRLAPILEKNGADYLHVSAGVYGSTQLTIPSMYVEHGCFVHLAEAVKRVVDIPVVGVGRIKSPGTGRPYPQRRAGGHRGHGPRPDRRSDAAGKGPRRESERHPSLHRLLPGLYSCCAGIRARCLRGQSRCGPRVSDGSRRKSGYRPRWSWWWAPDLPVWRPPAWRPCAATG